MHLISTEKKGTESAKLGKKGNIVKMFTEMIYEVDLRDRETGNSVETIHSGADSDEAYRIADHWNTEHGFARNDYESYDDLLFSASLKSIRSKSYLLMYIM